MSDFRSCEEDIVRDIITKLYQAFPDNGINTEALIGLRKLTNELKAWRQKQMNFYHEMEVADTMCEFGD